MSQSDVKPEHLPKPPVLKPILFSLLILISGVIIGAGTTLIVVSKQTFHPGGRTLERMTRELGLSPQQQAQLEPILQKHRKAMDDLYKENRPKLIAIFEQMNTDIMAILNEQQKQVWEEKVQQLQKRFEDMRQRRGPGGGRRDGTGPHGPGEGRRGPGGGRRRGGPPPEGGPMSPGEQPPREEQRPPEPNMPVSE